MVLIDQLDLLGATMDQVFDAVCRADAAALVAHGRFLAEKFGTRVGGGDLARRRPGDVDPAAPARRLEPPGRLAATGRLHADAPRCGRRRWRRARRRGRVAAAAGVDAAAARAEGAALAAAVAESAPGAAGDWAAATRRRPHPDVLRRRRPRPALARRPDRDR